MYSYELLQSNTVLYSDCTYNNCCEWKELKLVQYEYTSLRWLHCTSNGGLMWTVQNAVVKDLIDLLITMIRVRCREEAQVRIGFPGGRMRGEREHRTRGMERNTVDDSRSDTRCWRRRRRRRRRRWWYRCARGGRECSSDWSGVCVSHVLESGQEGDVLGARVEHVQAAVARAHHNERWARRHGERDWRSLAGQANGVRCLRREAWQLALEPAWNRHSTITVLFGSSAYACTKDISKLIGEQGEQECKMVAFSQNYLLWKTQVDLVSFTSWKAQVKDTSWWSTFKSQVHRGMHWWATRAQSCQWGWECCRLDWSGCQSIARLRASRRPVSPPVSRRAPCRRRANRTTAQHCPTTLHEHNEDYNINTSLRQQLYKQTTTQKGDELTRSAPANTTPSGSKATAGRADSEFKCASGATINRERE